MSTRRYTLYADSEAEREAWHQALVDAIALRKARQESNMVSTVNNLCRMLAERFFLRQMLAPHTVTDGFFKVAGDVSSNPRIHGKIKCATTLGTHAANTSTHLIELFY
jgi:hypothetical protein